MALLGRTAQQRDDHPSARSFFDEALSIQRQQADGQGMTWSMLYLARTALEQYDFAEARQLLEECMSRALELGDTSSVARALELVAQAAVTQLPSTAVLLLSAAGHLREALDSAPYPLERQQLDRCLAAARGALDVAAFDTAVQTGARTRLERAITEALRTLASLTR
jgi:hypothetical protein